MHKTLPLDYYTLVYILNDIMYIFCAENCVFLLADNMHQDNINNVQT